MGPLYRLANLKETMNCFVEQNAAVIEEKKNLKMLVKELEGGENSPQWGEKSSENQLEQQADPHPQAPHATSG